MTDIFFLKASVPLTKSYKRLNPQELIKTPYPFVWEFTSIKESVSSLAQLEPLLKSHAANGHCMLKGVIGKPRQKTFRSQHLVVSLYRHR